MKRDADAGFWAMGGATLDAPPQDGKPMAINGSVMLAKAGSEKEVMDRLRQDVYYVNGVWDVDQASCSYRMGAKTDCRRSRYIPSRLQFVTRCRFFERMYKSIMPADSLILVLL